VLEQEVLQRLPLPLSMSHPIEHHWYVFVCVIVYLFVCYRVYLVCRHVNVPEKNWTFLMILSVGLTPVLQVQRKMMKYVVSLAIYFLLCYGE